MEKPLYYDDSYLREFEAVVESVSDKPDSNNKFIVLDNTAFYPNGGGQPSDEGTMTNELGEVFKVVFVGKFGGSISHEVEAHGGKEVTLNKGDTVTCRIDWERRYVHMKMHTASHIIAAMIQKESGALISGNQLANDKSRVDFTLDDYDPNKLQEWIDKSNEIIQKNLPVTVKYITWDDANKDPTLFKLVKAFPHKVEELRIVSVGDFDRQADGGTHVKSTKEIGKVVFLKGQNKGKNNRRLYFELQ